MQPSPSILAPLLQKSLAKRKSLFTPSPAFRAFSGPTEGIPGTFLDIYAHGATLITYEGTTPARFNPQLEAQAALEVLANSPLQTRAIYHKPFARDRSKLGGQLPEIVTDPKPLAGDELPESLTIREHTWNLEVRLYDGLSTGLFLDQRNNRKFLADWIAKRNSKNRATDPSNTTDQPLSILNTFAYTCAFSIAAATAGALTTSVDISPRYLDWGKRNFALNNIDPAQHRFARMDTFEFFDYAQRKNLSYDFIVLDPPSFAAANKKRGTKAWSSLAHYATLVGKASQLLRPGGRGVIFASTNTQELCHPGRLEREVEKGLSTFRRRPKYLQLPPTPIDFAMEKDRFAALAFECA